MNDVATPNRSGSERELPAARVRRQSRLPLVWLVPLLAAALAGYLAWNTFSQRGSTIEISFETAEGLEPDKTRVKYRNVDVGTVRDVSLSPDLDRIVVKAEMTRNADKFLASGTRFWIVRPRVGAGGVSGLGTLVSGAYIEVDPGAGERSWQFTGLEEPPEIRSNVPGRSFNLRADRLGSVSRGAPVFYRGLEVGQVQGYELARNDRDALFISVFVRAPYDGLVHQDTRFWDASGLSLSTGANGFAVKFTSLQAIITGGIEFETPPAAVDSPVAMAGAEFALFPDADSANQANYTHRLPFLVDFDGSARGLRPGAPVEVRGIRVGTVNDVRLAFSPARQSFYVRALIELEPERVLAIDADTGRTAPAPTTSSIDELVGRGLRAQLKTGSLITGDLVVDLDFHPEAPPTAIERVGDKQVIPAVPNQFETLQASATQILEKVASLPLAETLASLRATIESVNGLVGDPQTKDAVASLRTALDELGRVVGPLAASVQTSAAGADATLRQARETLGAAQALLASGSPLQTDARDTLRELQGTARSVRVFTDYLQRHPEALLRGRTGG